MEKSESPAFGTLSARFYEERSLEKRNEFLLTEEEADAFCGFHVAEPYEDRLLRWSEGCSHLALNLDQAEYRFVLELAPIRKDLDSCILDFYFNDSKLTRWTVNSSYGVVSGVISKDDFADSDYQIFGFVCLPMARGLKAAKDRRSLGLPLLSIRFELIEKEDETGIPA